MKLSPKSNQGFICDWIWVKPSCKSIITTKEALLRFTVVSFLGKLIFNGVQGHFYASIKITIFKTLRRLNTTWNCARSIARVSLVFTSVQTESLECSHTDFPLQDPQTLRVKLPHEPQCYCHGWRYIEILCIAKVLVGKSCHSVAILATPRKAQRDQTPILMNGDMVKSTL